MFFDKILQCDAPDELHGDVIQIVDLTEVINLHNVNMHQIRHQFGLSDEHLDKILVVRQVLADGLNGYLFFKSLHPMPGCLEHLSHSARSNFLDELIGGMVLEELKQIWLVAAHLWPSTKTESDACSYCSYL